MFTMLGSRYSLCDGISRRGFLRVGGLGLCGLSLADLLRLQAKGQASPANPMKSVIMLFLPGGPSHIDMYDLKPDAPVEYRSPFKSIQTAVPGLDICEHMPLQAKIANRFTLVRSIRMPPQGSHFTESLLSGYQTKELSAGQPGTTDVPRPAFGCAVSRLRRADCGALPYVSIGGSSRGVGRFVGETPSYLGAAHGPFFATGPEAKDLILPAGMTLDRLADRKAILGSFDTLRRDIDVKGEMAARDAYTARALDLVAASRVRDAFDLDREPESLRQRYRGWENLLLARRLVEAGVRVVTLSYSDWDGHGKIFPGLKGQLSVLDKGVATIIADLHERGLDQQVTVVVWGEFGRTPRINQFAGRDHWNDVNFALFAGGGLRMGQVIGATDARAERVVSRVYSHHNVLATVYHLFGIDPALTFLDQLGRARPILDDPKPIAELV